MNSLAQRLQSNHTPIPEAGCWLWDGAWNRAGYGMIWSNATENMVLAHRAAWEVANGDIPAGMKVLHRCDTPACINPAHLFLGSQADNVADMDTKGRRKFRVGVANPIARLTEETVREIRASPSSNAALALTYGVSAQTISTARRRKLWSHVR